MLSGMKCEPLHSNGSFCHECFMTTAKCAGAHWPATMQNVTRKTRW